MIFKYFLNFTTGDPKFWSQNIRELYILEKNFKQFWNPLARGYKIPLESEFSKKVPHPNVHIWSRLWQIYLCKNATAKVILSKICRSRICLLQDRYKYIYIIYSSWELGWWLCVWTDWPIERSAVSPGTSKF